jgi:glycosyltransferase involved in cell wall biosynthesis
MAFNVRIVSTYPPRQCGIGTFSRNLADALETFVSEVGTVRIAAIDKGEGPYNIPVDLVIDQYSPESWSQVGAEIVARAHAGSNPTAALLQHEYGLDPAGPGRDGEGTNYVELAKMFQQEGLVTLAYLHTVLDNPDPHQKAVVQGLAKYCDGLVVTTESAIDILESDVYGVDHDKLKHIDHGIRMRHPSQFDRLAIKQEFGLEDRFLATTLGLLSPDKGLHFGIQGFGRFLDESCTPEQRKKMVYLIAGQCHPEFVRAEGGKVHQEFQAMLQQALEKAAVKWCRVDRLEGVDFDEHEVVFLDTFLDESTLLKLYGATNVMILPYLNMQQISSGILADTLGAGRVAIATKFRYARELIYSNKQCPPGVLLGRYVRGILVDPGEASIEQIAAGLDYVAFHKARRLIMEKQAHQRGYQMRWDNSAWAMLQYAEFLNEGKEIVTGRGVTFAREKPSIFERIKVRPSMRQPK